ncbi:MAG: prepilin peptidase [Candidatus Micrarchaeota archaeon]|nr:prepilin peptidase [Candidatus Micrarchaeota archaeon]
MPFPAFDVGLLRIAALLAIGIVFAAYDIFNRRNIPNVFAFGSVAIGAVFTLALGDVQQIVYSVLVASVVGALSYLLYKIGQMGLGDGFEFVAISLIMPLQPAPLLQAVGQLGLPFMLSVFVAAGIAAIVLVPAYCIAKMRRGKRLEPLIKIRPNTAIKAAIMLLAYGALLLFVTYSFGFNLIAWAIVVLIGIPSVVAIIYEGAMKEQMVKWVYPKELEAEDFIAIELMGRKEEAYFGRRYKKFGRVATKEMVLRLRGAKRKLPVYKNAIPLAFPTLIGIVAALLFGNPILLIL